MAMMISYPLFVDVDIGIYPHATPQHHTQPKAMYGIVRCVEKNAYGRQQRGVRIYSIYKPLYLL